MLKLKKIVMMGILLITTTTLANINDYRHIFSQENIKQINIAIDNFEKKTGDKIYINTLQANDEFKTEEQNKVVIVNLIKKIMKHKDSLVVQIKLSQDLNFEGIDSDLSLLLENVKRYVGTKDESILTIKLIEGLKEIILTNSDDESANFESKWIIKIFIGILLTFLLLSIRIVYVKLAKKKLGLR